MENSMVSIVGFVYSCNFCTGKALHQWRHTNGMTRSSQFSCAFFPKKICCSFPFSSLLIALGCLLYFLQQETAITRRLVGHAMVWVDVNKAAYLLLLSWVTMALDTLRVRMQVWETEDPSKTARVGGMHALESNTPNTIYISCCMTWLSTKEERTITHRQS